LSSTSIYNGVDKISNSQIDVLHDTILYLSFNANRKEVLAETKISRLQNQIVIKLVAINMLTIYNALEHYVLFLMRDEFTANTEDNCIISVRK